MKQIAQALLKSLVHAKVIKTPESQLKVHAEKQPHGNVVCYLEGGTFYEKSLFLDALEEVLEPIDNPRYLLKRNSLFWRLKRVDIHAVPKALGNQKNHALHFWRMWEKHVGPAKLIFTRSSRGRAHLVQSRFSALSTAFQKRSERLSVWK